MLGSHADAFFRKQATERVVALSPNGQAESIAFPDRELAGTGNVHMVSGSYEMPGSQDTVSANAMIPGVGAADMLPGLGEIDTKSIMIAAGVGVAGVVVLMFLKKRKAKR